MNQDHPGYTLRYSSPAYTTMYGWQSEALPMGNGYFGASFYGGVEKETLTISENTMYTGSTGWLNDRLCSGNESFCTLSISTDHDPDHAEGYVRSLSLDRAIGSVRYSIDGADYTREYFCSYPHRVLAIKLSVSRPGALGCVFFVGSDGTRSCLTHLGDGSGRSAEYTSDASSISFSGHSEFYNIDYFATLSVSAQGSGACVGEDTAHRVRVSGADSVLAVFSMGTNYVLSPHVFDTDDRLCKLYGTECPTKDIKQRAEQALKLGYDELLKAHLEDYTSLFGRVSLRLENSRRDVFTDVLLDEYKHGSQNPYIHELLYQYSRYLMISSSRPGGLPAALQGIWNVFTVPPWTNGYWYNINIQMNYWNVFAGNTAECFTPFHDFNSARMPRMQRMASNYILATHPSEHEEGQGADGWIVGTGNSSYTVGAVGGHSGPGTGGLTTALYYDMYKYSQNDEQLRTVVLPMLRGMARFYVKCVMDLDGEYLASPSSSPEQKILGNLGYINTVGCGFDQQMIYENNRHYLELCRILGTDRGEDRELCRLVLSQIDKYSPVIIGKSGQIKEYREEQYYGDMGDPYHRHISHLLCTAPCTVVSRLTPAWLDSASISLDGRKNRCGGWALANRMLCRARTGEGCKAKETLDELICHYTYPNLWTNYDRGYEFQIDASFGTGAAIGEMLMQSHEECTVRLLPAINDLWSCGSFSGICARGGFECSLDWQDAVPVTLTVLSKAGKLFKLAASASSHLCVTCDGRVVNMHTASFTAEEQLISFETEQGKEYRITGFAPYPVLADISDFSAVLSDGIAVITYCLPYGTPGTVSLLRATDSAPAYTEIYTAEADGNTTTQTVSLPHIGCISMFKLRFVSADGRVGYSKALPLSE